MYKVHNFKDLNEGAEFTIGGGATGQEKFGGPYQ
jgi:hypothetical protein